MKTKEINKLVYKYEFSFCTLVTDVEEYNKFISSCESKGFNENNSEFLYINNIDDNKYDAYRGINLLLSMCSGWYVILCHQDIRLEFDDIDILRKRVHQIQCIDFSWGVLGNAGGNSNLSELYMRISDPHGKNINTKNFPVKVSALDENFMLVKNGLNIGVSNDLTGFHLYGMDICMQAEIAGCTCYVIDFHLTHLSAGNLDSKFYLAKKDFLEKYIRVFQDKLIKSTCTVIFISSSRFKSRIFNYNIVKSIINRLQKIKFFLYKFREVNYE